MTSFGRALFACTASCGVALLVASSACSRPQPIAAVDGERATSTAKAAPLPTGEWKLEASSSSEHSCSQSFESTTKSVRFDLSIDAAGQALLAIERRTSSTYGPNGPAPGGAPPKVWHDTHETNESWRGVATAIDEGVKLSLQQVCTGTPCGKDAWAFECRTRTVSALAAYGSDAGTVTRPVLACELQKLLEPELQKSVVQGVPLAAPPGLMLSHHDYGYAGGQVELRVAFD